MFQESDCFFFFFTALMLSFHYTIFYAVMCYSLCIDIGVITNAELSRKINSTQLMLDFLTDAIIDS